MTKKLSKSAFQSGTKGLMNLSKDSKRQGGKISASELKGVLASGYKKTPDDLVGNWKLDPEISKTTALVYYNPTIDQAIVVHRGTEGTLSDWSNNLGYVLGVNKLSHRFKESERVQKRAEEKYPNLLTTGHSQGGIYTKIAKNQPNTILVNPASMGEGSIGTTIRALNDPVSAIANPLHKGTLITTKPKLNPLKAHSIDILDELGDKMLGNGMMDFIRNPLKEINKEIINPIKGKIDGGTKTITGIVYGAQDFAPYVRKIIEQYGDKKIVRAVAHRKPVDAPILGAINMVSIGQFAKQNKYDDLFHLSLFLIFEDGTPISIEKIENINMQVNPPTHEKAQTKEISNFHPVTLNEILNGAKQVLGDKFFKYNASSNNCQHFIMALLQGSDLGGAEDYAFIKQDTEQIFKGLDKTLSIANALTSIGNRGSVALYGGKLSKAPPKRKGKVRKT